MSDHSLEERRGEDRRSRSEDRRNEGAGIRTSTILAFGLICAAVSGYFIGVRSPMNPPRDEQHTVAPESARVEQSVVVPSTTYTDFPAVRASLKQKQTAGLSSLKQMTAAPGVSESGPIGTAIQSPVPIDSAEKLISLTKRTLLRAYDGAPPTVPHGIAQMSSQACMACHEHGIRTSTLRASKMPHPFYTNCTQCHVERSSDRPSTMPNMDNPNMDNSFVGLESSPGSRAFTTAPPSVPHPVWMRNDCLGCHGRTAAGGLQTTHPWRANCLQCHAAPNESRPIPASSPSPFLPPPTIEVNDES
ncbi:MAG: cytochrome c-type protein NapB [Pirellulaceae bacterium]|jgi:cytochrome c-type protein NapB